jgi:hypothetical protein
MATGVSKVHFWGQRERPLMPNELAERVPVTGTSKMPKDLLELNSRSVYVTTAKAKAPVTEVTKIGRHNGRTLWRIAIPDQEDQKLTSLFGKTRFEKKQR